MNPKRLLPTLLGALLFISGVTISLSLSGVMVWGEIEARIFIQQTGEKDLKLECPLMIASWETAVIRTVVTNTLRDDETKPQVQAFISQEKNSPRVVVDTLELTPLESRSLQWTVDSKDMVFDRLILVNILQRPYRKLPSHQSACSILVFDLAGMSGRNALALIASSGILASLLGAWIFYIRNRPLAGFMINFAQLNMVFLGLTLLSLLTALFRIWGFTIFFIASAFLVITTGSVEIFLSRKK